MRGSTGTLGWSHAPQAGGHHWEPQACGRKDPIQLFHPLLSPGRRPSRERTATPEGPPFLSRNAMSSSHATTSQRSRSPRSPGPRCHPSGSPSQASHLFPFFLGCGSTATLSGTKSPTWVEIFHRSQLAAQAAPDEAHPRVVRLRASWPPAAAAAEQARESELELQCELVWLAELEAVLAWSRRGVVQAWSRPEEAMPLPVLALAVRELLAEALATTSSISQHLL
mmetsp:Transcript_19904/g.46308  ORF Transcript_19904/g.46308 Transcript_19904/m.46308 type:complete len:225 (-) Transcript_19904:968-1642(-)